MTTFDNRLIFLGCGSSQGVPQIDDHIPHGNWGDCDPAEPRNNRTRSAVYVEYQGVKILVDAGPDLRPQYLRVGLTDFDALVFTHYHGDHTYGIPELHVLYQRHQKKFNLYANQATLTQLKNNFTFYFDHFDLFNCFVIDNHEPLITVGGIPIKVIRQQHGHITSLGYRFGNVLYSTDFTGLDDDQLGLLDNLDTWILDCTWLSYAGKSHLNLEQALSWYQRIKPKQMFLTHMNYTMDYGKLCKLLPPEIRPAYDGLTLKF